ncbi:hypothetical protein RN001_003506 [Aquatica leii]|uniref:Small ribosomal subunit protein uS10m n=1 Tax=Aquatica leii TaxID=1421715 RepID=A0AAN7ST15_9COLE|nr:hypothetical protein RN001_003506 [Aquatica leii]
MNCLIQSLKPSSLRIPVMNVFRTLETVASVNPVEQKTMEPSEELDKLYKIVEVELRGNEPAVLRSFAKFATTAGQHLDVQCKSWNLKKPIHERYTVLKAAHIYKKHRVQYETRTYYMFVQYKHLTGSTADTLLEYIERNLPEGVALKATKVELQRLPDYFKPLSS